MARYVIQPERDEYADRSAAFRAIEGTKFVPVDDDADADVFTVYEVSGPDPVLVADYLTRADAEDVIAALDKTEGAS